MKCKVCGREATRLHARHDDGTLEYLCEEHYGYWHPELAESRKNCLLEAKYAPIRIPENLIARLQPLGPHFIRVAKRGKEPTIKIGLENRCLQTTLNFKRGSGKVETMVWLEASV